MSAQRAGILALSASLCLWLAGIRALLTGARTAPEIAAGAYQDVAVVALIALACLAAARRGERSLRIFAVAAILILIAGLVNVKAVELLGGPVNYQWLYYADFLANRQALAAILSTLTPRLMITGALACAGMLVLGHFLRRPAEGLLALGGGRGAPLIAAALALYLALGARHATALSWDSARLQNPLVSFLSSLARPPRAPALANLPTPFGSEDFEGPAARPVQAGAAPRKPAVKNVLVFVMESVGAEHLRAYGGAHDATPELDRRLPQAMIFNGIYAQSPSSNKSLVSLLCSAHPWLSQKTLTEARPDAPLPSVSAELSRRGWRTAFLSVGDFRWKRGDEFIRRRGFDAYRDYRSPGCSRRSFAGSLPGWPFLDGKDDLCLADSFRSWLDEPGSTGRPFFTVMWTYQTHMPYFVSGGAKDFKVPDPAYNRYLNAIRRGDQALGAILDLLEKRGILDETLVVVLGDHGEAFRHAQTGHASGLYEENLGIPLVLINSRLFHGEKRTALGGIVDVAPTVMDLLGLAAPDAWQGRSLFSSDRGSRAYYFAPVTGAFALRQDNLKLIYDENRGVNEVYDLAADPLETRNIAASVPGFVAVAHQRLAAWVRHRSRWAESLQLR